MTRDPVIRIEQAGDGRPVRAVLEAAFGRAQEAHVVDELRARGELVLALVAAGEGGAILGYAAFPRLALAAGGRSMPAVGLAPAAVAPAHQRRGIGSALIRAGIARLRSHGERLMFVLGDPGYYRRFGFAVIDGFVSPYAGPHFQTLKLAPGAPDSGRVSYPPPFANLR
jgi:putative acetyltransferase